MSVKYVKLWYRYHCIVDVSGYILRLTVRRFHSIEDTALMCVIRFGFYEESNDLTPTPR